MAEQSRSFQPGIAPRQNELICLVRAVAGGFVFAVPVIYTMEVWWLGFYTPTWKVLLFLLIGYLFAVGLNYFSGFREDEAPREYFMDAVEALAIGCLVGGIMLAALGVITPQTPPLSALKQTLISAVPISIGASLARSVLGSKGDGQDMGDAVQAETGINADLKDVGVTIIGGVFLGLSIAPTEEILMISNQVSWPHWIALATISILLSYALIFMADFSGQARRLKSKGALQAPWGETIVTYAVSLGVSFGLLWFMGFLKGITNAHEILSMVLILGLPVTVGGAGGRLVV